jgi:hypothetical protein
MKPFVWITALLLGLLFLAGAAFTLIDAVNDAEFLTSPKLKIAVGWLVTGLMFLSLGFRGWRSRRRNIRAENQRGTARTSN